MVDDVVVSKSRRIESRPSVRSGAVTFRRFRHDFDATESGFTGRMPRATIGSRSFGCEKTKERLFTDRTLVDKDTFRKYRGLSEGF